KSGFLCKNRETRRCANGRHLNFDDAFANEAVRWAASVRLSRSSQTWAACNVKRPFFVAPPVLLHAATRKQLSPLPPGHAMSKPASSRWGTETRWSSCARRDIEQGREITQLHRLRHRRQYLGGIEQRLRRLLLSLCVDDLGTAGAFGLGLAGDCPDHALVEIDALDLHGRDLDTPPLGLLVEHVLDVGIELVALGQHLIEIVLAQHPAQRGLRKLAGCGEIIVDL